MTPWDSQSVRVFSQDGIAPALDIGIRAGGRRWPTVLAKANTCMASGQANAEINQDGISPTLTLLHEAPIVIDRAAYNQGVNAQYPPHIEQTEVMDALVARGPHAVACRG